MLDTQNQALVIIYVHINMTTPYVQKGYCKEFFSLI